MRNTFFGRFRRAPRGKRMDTAELNICQFEAEAFLGRSTLQNDLPETQATYSDHSILITGAGGSIGSELCRQLLTFKPKRLVLLDHSEHALYAIDQQLRDLTETCEIEPVLGSVTSPDLISQTLRNHGVDIVLHAAAYKHVPIVEKNILEGLRNNILGTRVVADAALRTGVENFILVSSDKAVRPKSIMGCSKRMAEFIVQDLATRSHKTRFSIVRFGNVIGSSGSVVPLFGRQIRRGGPVTVTHPDATRFFMTLSEAVQLVLLAGSLSRGGDVFALDMGKPLPILALAKNMIRAHGFSVKDKKNPKGDIEIQFTGLRPGEKMHEELLIGRDMLTTPHPKILRAQETYLSEIQIASALQDLRCAIESRNEALAVATLHKWVEGFGGETALQSSG